MTEPTEVEVRSPTGKFVLGHILTLEDGTKIYLARRKHGALFRSGCKTISDAMATEKCGWAIDERTLLDMRSKGVTHIGVRTIDTEDIYLAPMMFWFDRKKYVDHNYEGIGRGGSKQRLLYLKHFDLKSGTVHLSI